MGTYRLILALAVLYSHAFGTIWGLNSGVSAVISFFIISGYLMTGLIRRNYPQLDDVPAFYLDRFTRLFPQFLFYLLATVAVLPWIGTDNSFLTDGSLEKVVLNAAMLPLGYYMFGLEHALYIPPSWSLGLELTFYLVFPFFMLTSDRMKIVVVLTSSIVFIAAFFGVINTDWFAYRLLPGTFFMFVIGSWRQLGKHVFVLVSLFFFIAVLGLAIASPALRDLPYNLEVTIGAVIGTIAILILPRIPRNKVDDYLGNLSYGLFLNHYLVIFIADHYGIPKWAIVPAAALVLSAISYEVIEKTALRFRQQLRRTRKMTCQREGQSSALCPSPIVNPSTGKQLRRADGSEVNRERIKDLR
ncbi:acyltransferase family protein [Rhizobium rhizogenes]|uniref:acyltransferase family protein n=1 Tax=Rhizobium rhizogenes TaxID=359 RepID=UPI00068E672A|nr:acyltransferase [Rhizobium rhizogenes]NTI80471.1 acyltransferase [Rhizobium rhizogenes]NTJ22657.1 acyltransferase [Rhizobium rhizogenes]QUE81361.1 acyltransferase [Rhizobium rhizogenes]